MAIKKFVHDIQTIFLPKEKIPPGPSHPIGEFDKSVQPEISPIERPRAPSWVNEGKFTLVPKGSRITIEENLPIKLPGILPSGIDVLAYYLPFHFYSTKWGIYVLASGILSVASMLVSASEPKLSKNEDALAFAILMHHESFHFFCEIACARAELLVPA